MIKFENTHVIGWDGAIRGMRNPMNSWAKGDSRFSEVHYDAETNEALIVSKAEIGPNDLDLMKRLRRGGPDDRKYLRMIAVYVDITAPLYWWKEFDTYKVGTVANSCSTMHKIHAKEFTLDDFSHEHLNWQSKKVLEDVVCALNNAREFFNRSDGVKDDWWQMIQLLPSSYNQRRTVMMNYEVLCNQHHARKNHRLDEWREYCKWVETLPHAELICGEKSSETIG